MARVFVSYSSGDDYFVSLLVKLLKFHYIDAWCSSWDIKPGTQFPLAVEQAIKDANILLVVTSENTVKSKWVTKEITIFQTHNNDALLVPLLLDSTNLDFIVPGLNYYQSIDFSESLLVGYESLFSLLGRDFLSFKNRRNAPTRRISEDRRNKDRRESSLIQRLRLGFWKRYSQISGKGEFSELEDKIGEKIRISESLLAVACKYQYFDSTNHECEPKEILEVSTHKVWNAMKNSKTFKPIYVIEGIAEDIHEQYQVRTHSGRRGNGRRLPADNRRKGHAN